MTLVGNNKLDVCRILDSFNNRAPNGWQDAWKDCYDFFGIYINSNANLSITSPNGLQNLGMHDLANLNLTSYLTSFGMYRGSSFLSGTSSRMHHNLTTAIIKDPKYKTLRGCTIQTGRNNITLICELIDNIKTAYGTNNSVTTTLSTKIILATFCCLPAYDRYANEGFASLNLPRGVTQRSLKKFFDFLLKHDTEFQNCATKLDIPVMRVVDIYFFEIGYQILG